MTSFEFGTTPAPRGPFDNWEWGFSEPPAGEHDQEPEPVPCTGECCVPTPREGGGLL